MNALNNDGKETQVEGHGGTIVLEGTVIHCE
jgi:hypothetical protein